jgi:hypothetical protein
MKLFQMVLDTCPNMKCLICYTSARFQLGQRHCADANKDLLLVSVLGGT